MSEYQDGWLVGKRGAVLACCYPIGTDMERPDFSAEEWYALSSLFVLVIICTKIKWFVSWFFFLNLHFNSALLLPWFEGWKTIKGALVMPLMIQGYKKGLIKFTIITCRKPQAAIEGDEIPIASPSVEWSNPCGCDLPIRIDSGMLLPSSWIILCCPTSVPASAI